MLFRLATSQDLNAAVAILHDGRASLAAQGSDQWQGGAPFEDMAAHDIDAGALWVAENNEGVLVGVITLLTCGEDDYRRVEHGAWLTDSANALSEGTVSYAVLHRLAVHHSYVRQGVATFLLQSSFEQARKLGMKSVRVDTHEKNLPMQHGFLQCGMTQCCDITITSPFEPTKERVGFEILL